MKLLMRSSKLKLKILTLVISIICKTKMCQLFKLFKVRNLKYEKKKLSHRTQVNPTIVSSSYANAM
jgi:hypothetical protein